MSRGVTIHALLLAGALVGAYFVWTREPSGSGGEQQDRLVEFELHPVRQVPGNSHRLANAYQSQQCDSDPYDGSQERQD